MMKKFLYTTAIVFAITTIANAQSGRVGIGESAPGSKGSIKGNLSVGSTYSTITAPADGAIIQGRVGIGTSSPNTGAALDISSTDKGVLVPRVANTSSITTPSDGMLVYNTTTNKFNFYDGATASWKELGNAGATGATGAQGDTGANGAQGANGASGATGATGLLPNGITGASPYYDGTDWVTNSTNIYNNGTNVGIGGTGAPSVKLDITGTDAINFPKGTTLQRPASPQAGYTRFNTDIKAIEYYDGSQWISANVEQTPIGTIVPYGGSTAPSGWLICNGSGVSTTTYADLFAITGYTYGGSGGTFNLPDLRGKAAFGLGTSAPFNNLGNTGGSTSSTPSLSHNLALDIAAFNATLPVHTHSLPAHFHGIGAGAGLNTTAATSGTPSNNTSGSGGGHAHTFSGTSSTNGDHTHGIRCEFGTGSNLNSGPPGNYNQVTNNTNYGYINSNNPIQITGAHAHTYSGTTTTDGAHTHDLGNHTHSVPSVAVTGNIGLVTGGENGNAAMNSGNNSGANVSVDPPSTTVTGTITANSVDFTNPYQVVNYIIKATNENLPSIVAVNTASGTAGQTLYNNGANWAPTSNLYNDGTNVGVGTTTPSALLDVNGTARVRTLGTGVVKSNSNGNLSSSLITNADVADVAWNKVTGAPAFITGNQNITLSGDVSGSGTTAISTTIGNNAVSYGKFQQVAASSLVGNPTGSTANTQAVGLGAGLSFSGNNIEATDNSITNELQNLSYTASTGAIGISSGTGTTIPEASATVRGLVPTPPNDINLFLRGNGTWGAPTASLSGGTTNAMTYWTSASLVSGATGSGGAYWDNTNGRLGIGISSPAYNLDVNGSMRVSTNNAPGGGIFLADDGSIVDNNDGFATMRFSSGVIISNGNNTNTARITLGSNGNITATSLTGTGNRPVYADANGLLNTAPAAGNNYVPECPSGWTTVNRTYSRTCIRRHDMGGANTWNVAHDDAYAQYGAKLATYQQMKNFCNAGNALIGANNTNERAWLADIVQDDGHATLNSTDCGNFDGVGGRGNNDCRYYYMAIEYTR